MAVLPDELWRRIIEIVAIANSPNSLNYKDICSLSITCKTLKRISGEDFIWSYLLSSDFSQSSSSSPAKSQYKLWFERDKEKKVLAHKRAVLRIESKIAVHYNRIREIKSLMVKETERMKAAASELSNIQKARQASVALNVWQPEIVMGRQKQIVEQCKVNVNSRIIALEMELKLCKQQIAGFDKAHRDEKIRLHDAKDQLASIMYHPLRDYKLPTCSSSSSKGDERNSYRKKLKTSNLQGDIRQIRGKESSNSNREG